MFSRPGTIFHSFACSISDTLPKSGLFIPEQSLQYSENENVSYWYLHRKTEAREGKKGEMEREKIPNRGWKQLNQIGLSCLFLSHITILILMRLPVFPTCFFSPSDDLNIKKKLKKRKFQELRITVWPGATQQTPTMTDSLFKARGSCFHQGILVGFFYSLTPPAHAICLFLKSQLQDELSACVLF